MKFNWVNLLATLLIIGGVALLIQRHWASPPVRHAPSVEEAKADIERQIGTKLGRPLSEAETDMIEVTKVGEQIDITIHQPLYGRLTKAIHDAKAATEPSAQKTGLTGPDLLPPVSDPASPDVAAPAPTTGIP